jgi:hypothetical protein
MLLPVFVTHDEQPITCLLSPMFFHTVDIQQLSVWCYIVLEIFYLAGSEISLLFSRLSRTLHLL